MTTAKPSHRPNEWLILLPPCGFLFYHLFPTTRTSVVFYVLSLMAFAATVLGFLACHYAFYLVPYFLEQFVLGLLRIHIFLVTTTWSALVLLARLFPDAVLSFPVFCTADTLVGSLSRRGILPEHSHR